MNEAVGVPTCVHEGVQKGRATPFRTCVPVALDGAHLAWSCIGEQALSRPLHETDKD